MKRRVKLKNHMQRKIILSVSKKDGSVRKLALRFKVPYSTFKNYLTEQRFLPEDLFLKLIKEFGDPNDLDISYLDSNWGRSLGGKRGIRSLQKSYPEKIIKWRKEAIKKAHVSNLIKIKKPSLNEGLAELIGAYLGDGTMTKYQFRIVGDSRYDKKYLDYLSKLISNLFRVKTSLIKHKRDNALLLVAYSKEVCDFLNKNFGIKPGDKIKNKTIIPKEIIKDEKLSIACLRGLMDTDGSVSRRGREGSQFCIQFTAHNKWLLEQVNKMGKNLKIFTFESKTGAGTNKWENIIRYFNIVGSSNPKHIIRFLLRKEGKSIYRDDLLYYFEQEKYKTLNLPFTLKGV